MLIAVLLFTLVVVSSFLVLVMRQQRALRAELETVRGLARVEAGTRLRNEQAFVEDLARELLRVERTGGAASLLVMGGEDVPALVGAVRKAVRSVDVGYRIGSEELAVILPDTRARGALVAARRIEGILGAGGLRAGVAEAGPGIDRHQLFRNAYCAMLAAGEEGRSQVLAYSPELGARGIGGELQGLKEIEAIDLP